MHAEFLSYFNPCTTDLRAYIGAVVRDVHAREDIFQEVCRTLWAKFDDYDIGHSFGAWARGIATRKMLEAKRQNARFPLVFPPETIQAIQQAFDADEEARTDQAVALEHCLAALPEHSRQILTWRYETRWPCDRIGQTLNLKTKAVHQILCRLRQGLAYCIQQRLANEDAPAAEPALLKFEIKTL
jgi:RNA polymerase sigma-70 factor (ECF subfamily)